MNVCKSTYYDMVKTAQDGFNKGAFRVLKMDSRNLELFIDNQDFSLKNDGLSSDDIVFLIEKLIEKRFKKEV